MAAKFLAAVAGPWPRLGRRCFGSTEGPFLYLKGNKFKDRKKHFNEVLIMADRRKLLETAQDIIDDPHRKFPKAFWEILAKRCIQSMHLLEPLELSIVARAFDMHQRPTLRRDLDVFQPLAAQVRASRTVPGLAIIVLADVLPRQLKLAKDDMGELLRYLARRAADVMWEIPAVHAVTLVQALSSSGVRDPALCSRVAQKLRIQLEHGNSIGEAGRAASAFAAQGHRDLELFRCLARAAACGLQNDSWELREEAEQSAWKVLESLDVLGIEGLEEAEPLRRALEFKAPTAEAAA
eukprot:TRINITY_DN97473_c0_g1_i1.p1 TRINITY_DN97473_c0_g1~~TRINITY_DN97473_c0_g1_i1.p1  ORF type:complete len:314 (+),score=77.46 TRINITY_DN97473_c0_g1_i1:61-942(+)